MLLKALHKVLGTSGVRNLLVWLKSLFVHVFTQNFGHSDLTVTALSFLVHSIERLFNHYSLGLLRMKNHFQVQCYWAIPLLGALTALTVSACGGSGASIDSVKTVVVIYGENRSFDNLYGLYPSANGISKIGRAYV